jgi:16S rRNA (cytosine1402-N4)-methyltransferase
VNNEISELIYGLINSFKLLPVGGVVAIVTFHSIEDKIVKFFLKNYSENKNYSRYLPARIEKKILFKLIDKKPIIPNNKELNLNPASRSAKLRYGVKLNNHSDFSEFVKKFSYLLEVEKLFKKI